MRAKKIFCILLALLLAVLCLISWCSSAQESEEEENEVEFVDETKKNTSPAADKTLRKGKAAVIQYIDYSSLNECTKGITKVLDESGIEYDVHIGGSDPENECAEIAQNIAINGGYDVIISVGTTASVAVYSSVNTAARIPVIFCAVTDPVGAGLVQSKSKPLNNCTGIACDPNIKEQLNMINTFQPSITKLGVIYTAEEQNTSKTLKELREGCKQLGITLYEAAAEDASQLTELAKKMVPEVQAITLLTDNMVSKNSWNIVNQAIIGQIPVYGVNISQVKEGCLAGYCLDFEQMGKQAAETALSVIKGQSAADTPVRTMNDTALYVNSDMLKDLEIDIPDEYQSIAQKVKTSYEN